MFKFFQFFYAMKDIAGLTSAASLALKRNIEVAGKILIYRVQRRVKKLYFSSLLCSD